MSYFETCNIMDRARRSTAIGGRVLFSRDVIVMTWMFWIGALNGWTVDALLFLVLIPIFKRSALYTHFESHAWRSGGVLAPLLDFVASVLGRGRFLYISCGFLRAASKRIDPFDVQTLPFGDVTCGRL
jgi:hypothetical protein